MNEKTSTIQSVERALDILEYICENGNECKLQDISEGVNLKKTTTHSLIKTLEKRGYLIRDLKSPKYSLGLNCMRLGMIYRRSFFAREKMNKLLEELVEIIGETAYFIVRVGKQYMYLDAVAPNKTIKTDTQIGVFKNLDTVSAISKIFNNFSENKMVDYEIDLEESEESINTLAVPFYLEGQLLGIIAIKGPAYRFMANNDSREIYLRCKKIIEMITNHN